MLLVTAGYDNSELLRSTEVQETRSSSWREVSDYPLAVTGLKGATVNNIVYMTGGWRGLIIFDETKWIVSGGGWSPDSIVNSVYRYEEGKWTEERSMLTARGLHSVSVVEVDLAADDNICVIPAHHINNSLNFVHLLKKYFLPFLSEILGFFIWFQ